MSQSAILPFAHARGSWGESGLTVGTMFAPLCPKAGAWASGAMTENRR